MSVASIAARIANAAAFFGRTPEERAVTWEDWMAGVMGGQTTHSGKKVSQENSVQLTVVWACVSLIADSVASATPEVVRDSEVIATPRWLEQPNRDMTRFEFFHQSTVSALLDGNSFWYVARRNDISGPIEELFLLDPSTVDVELDPYSGKRVYRVDGQPVMPSINGTGNLVHIPGIVLPGQARALSPIEAAAQAVGLGLAAEEFGAKFFANGATVSGVIEVPGALDKEQAKVMAQSFATNHQGLKRSHLPGVLTGGAKWTPITIPPEQAQFLETRRYQTAEIARLYRVPPHLVGDIERSTSWGTGIEEQNRNFIQYTLSPWTIRFEAALSALESRPRSVRLNMNNLLRGTKRERYETYNVGITGGFLTPDEARAEEGLPPLPDGLGAKPRPAPNESPTAAPTEPTMTEAGGSDESDQL